jgi:hypothetical protein
MTALSDLFYRRYGILTLLLLLPALLWLAVVYLGSLFALLLQSFYALDDFSGVVLHEFTLATYGHLLDEANREIIVRTVVMSAAVTIVSAIIACGTFCTRQNEGTILPRCHDATVVELSCQNLCLETGSGQGRHYQLGRLITACSMDD